MTPNEPLPDEEVFYSEILPLLWRGGSFGYFWSNDDGEGNKVTLWHTIAAGVSRVPTVWRQKMNCYFGIHPTIKKGNSWQRAKAEDIACVNCLYAEIDGLASIEQAEPYIDWLLELPLRPSLIIWSGGGLHIYWLLQDTFWLTEPDARARVILAQKAIVRYTNGDTTVHDLPRVLRIAGTTNRKPGRNGAIVQILHWESDDAYVLDDLEGMCQVYINELAHEAEASPLPVQPTNLEDAEAWRILFANKNGDMYRGLFDGNISYANDDDSVADIKLAGGLAWVTGRNLAQMDRMFRQSALLRAKWEEPRGESTYGLNTLKNAANTAQQVFTPSTDDGSSIAASLPPKATPEQSSTPHPNPPPFVPLWQVRTLQDALKPIEPLKFLVDQLLPYPSLSMVFGGPGSLKSMILADLAACIAGGLEWLKPEPMDAADGGVSLVTMQAPVLWIDFDNGRRRTDARIGAVARAHGLTEDLPFHYVSMPVPHLDASNGAAINALIAMVKRTGYKLIIVDNLGLITGAVEENSASMASVMGNLRRLAEDGDCAVMLIHHQRKSATNGNDNGVRKGESLRGHSSIEASLDLALLVERKGREDKVAIIPTKVRDFLSFGIIGACFSYQHFEGTKDLELARFYSRETMTAEEIAARDLRYAIIDEVIASPGMTQGELVDAARDTLAVRNGKAPAVNVVRGTIKKMAEDGDIEARKGGSNGYTIQYFK